MPRTRQFLAILTSQSLSRYNGVQFLDMLTSKSAPTLPVFEDFDFAIALSLQRGANFRHLNFQKCAVFEDFDFAIALSLQRGANFRHLNFQKRTVFEDFGFAIAFSLQPGANIRHLILTSKSAPSPPVLTTLTLQSLSRYNGMHNFRHLNFQKCSEPASF